mmetsp:Transcript_43880/g.58172  ORF Transcript_43880/g.58172 Transcript_43880/m.58172 type:complete len:232 (+) Transcript_43880:183-878(+)|eukprot:CAMPEP_0185570848 /NCGR_PEP_ID=MMETSP0434-20130131/3001_1 /TAXON_ID=626734 ORGANISM="Favella taraikaensis, Strain Fe Narragansett Bay" /NCGR_SAMPLE_ID=MMETSP0434 /ASSEMBLY_ACC=CAM_ASM_000379 /LENGTH=231 /DNA_ID=CAMNT_0028186059 /DNA_START=183 /DNA_END=878 /DNA_ORIENTATION=-
MTYPTEPRVFDFTAQLASQEGEPLKTKRNSSEDHPVRSRAEINAEIESSCQKASLAYSESFQNDILALNSLTKDDMNLKRALSLYRGCSEPSIDAISSLLKVLVIFDSETGLWADLIESGISKVPEAKKDCQTLFFEAALKAAVVASGSSRGTESPIVGIALCESLMSSIKETAPSLLTTSENYRALELRLPPAKSGLKASSKTDSAESAKSHSNHSRSDKSKHRVRESPA